MESGGGGPDYAGAYANNFTAADVAANPTAGTVATTAVTITAAGSTVVAFDTVLNPAVVYGGMASVNTTSARTIAVGSGSFAAVCKLSRQSHQGLVRFLCLSSFSIRFATLVLIVICQHIISLLETLLGSGCSAPHQLNIECTHAQHCAVVVCLFVACIGHGSTHCCGVCAHAPLQICPFSMQPVSTSNIYRCAEPCELSLWMHADG